MKKPVLCLIVIALLAFASISSAAQAPATDPLTVQVVVESSVLRALPTTDSDVVGSAFENDVLVAIGRNADGLWFEVRRPGTQFSAGWVFRRNLSFTFEVARLPITDLTTGVTGPNPLFDTGVSVFILTEANLRDRPSQNGAQIGTVPLLVTVPVIERSPDNRWLYVNYLGTVGWVAAFLTSTSADLNTLPITAAAGNFVQFEIIPVEVQLAQVERLRNYATAQHDLAVQVAAYWATLQTGVVIPCEPIRNRVEFFTVSNRDVVELPELRRFTRNLTAAVNDLNTAIDAMQRCGVYTSEEISAAYAKAINARGLFNAVLGTLNNVETAILQ